MKRKNQTLEPLAIVGMSCLYPKAQSLEDYWANIKEKVDAITEVPKTHWNAEDYYDSDKKAPDKVYATTGGFLDKVDFNPSEWGIAPSDMEAIDTSQLLSLIVAQGAMVDAGYGPKRDFNRDNVSVVLGLTGTLEAVIPLGARLGHPIWRKAMEAAGISKEISEEVVENIGNSYVSWQENSFPGLLGNVAAGRVANRLDLGGTNCVVDAACGSALSALNLAAMELWTGKTDMAITGGVDTFNDIFMYMCFCKTPALSSTGHARPFSDENDGTILGEGIGMAVLKRLSDAEKDGDKIYALINAVGTSSDGKGKAIYAPSEKGQEKALLRAYEHAGITPKDITMIEAHGTGTRAGDEVEVNALHTVYGFAEPGKPWCALGSVKSQIGHTKAAAGSAGILKAAAALYHKIIPPMIKVNKPSSVLQNEKTPFFLPDKSRPWILEKGKKRYAAVSSLGFGGSNYHVILSEYEPTKKTYDWTRGVEIFSFAGDNKAAILGALNSVKSLKTPEEIRLAAAKSRSTFNHKAAFRLCFVAENAQADLTKLANDIEAQLQKDDVKSFSLPNGAYFSSMENTEKLGVIFPGQGAQYTNMCLELACLSPEFFETLVEADNEVGEAHESGKRLVDCVYPIPTYDEEKDKQNEELLKATQIAQPAIGATSLGAYRLMEKLGLKPAAFAGHSYGELTSLCAAGAFDSATLARLSKKRGELMASGEGDRGGMIAISGDRKEIENIIAEEKLDLVVANHNSPTQVVLSGATEEIQKSQKVFKARKLRGTILKVAGAFHSKFVADAAEPFHKFLKNEKISKCQLPVYSNTTSELYPEKADEIKKLLGFQLANQVRFVEIIERMYADGIKNFIEIGPGGKMIGLVKAILKGREFETIALDSSAGKRNASIDLARALAQLSAMGYELDLKAWHDGEAFIQKVESTPKPKFTFPLYGCNYRTPRKEVPKKAPARTVVRASDATKAAPAVQAPKAPSAPAISHTPPQPSVSVQQPQVQAQPQRQMAPAAQTYPTINAGSSLNLNVAQQTLSALQAMQQQTAELHKRFLEGQEQAQMAIQNLVMGTPMAAPQNYQPQQINMPTAPAQLIQPVPVAPTYQAPQPVTAQPIAPKPQAAKPAPAPSATTQAPKASPAVDKIKSVLIDIVSEKTGYPKEMLDLNMDMEADLGIDSIKRVEIMSAMQEKLPEAPVVQPDQLGKLRTLAQILEHLNQGQPSSAASAQPAPAASGVSAQAIETALLEVVSEKTGYPRDMLNMEMDMEADLGIDSIKRVEIMSSMQEKMPEAPVVQPDQLGKLRTLSQIIEHLASSLPATAAPAVTSAAPVANNIQPVLIEIVSEKTGYPADMLNLDMDMEADLGIDSIKRVEIMSAMQERLPDAPVIQPDQLGKLRTLAQILDFLGANAPATQAPQVVQAAPAAGNIQPVLVQIVSEKTGYPADMLDLNMDMEADLGIDSIKRVEIMSAVQEQLPNAPVIQPDQLGKLRTLTQIIEFLGAGAAEAAQPAVQDTTAASSNIQPVLVQIVSEKTGYPADMLDLNMDMEADLGIDSIKRVEIMSAVQEQLPDAPVIQPDQLGKLRTLTQIIEFLSPKGATAPAPTMASASAGGVDQSVIKSNLISIVAEKTGYPEDMLDLNMDMEADLGIDSIKRVEILSAFQEKVPNAPVVQPGDLGNFRTIAQIIEYLNSASPAASTATAAAPAEAVVEAEEFPLKRTIIEAVKVKSKRTPLNLKKGKFLVAGDGSGLEKSVATELKAKGFDSLILGMKEAGSAEMPSDLVGVLILGAVPKRSSALLWKADSEETLKDAFFVAQNAGTNLRKNKGLIATVARLDGAFGLAGLTKSSDPTQGGFAGITKTIRHEWEEVTSRAIDMDNKIKDNDVAAKLLVEELLLEGAVETGISENGIVAITEVEKNLFENGSSPVTFSKGDVIIVSGGARGVTAEVAITMAEKFQTSMALFGRSPVPEAEPAWLKNLSSEPEIKQAILKNSTTKITPKELGAEYNRLMGNREILTTLSRIEKAGAKSAYYSLDVRSEKEVEAIVEKVKTDMGNIRGLIHGAGVLRDRKIEDKTRDQLDAVIDTKVIGLRNTLSALLKEELKAVILFSSFSGRFGRLGQVDYSMANEVLNKTAQKLRIMRPECRVLSFNWGPWDGGMVNSSLRSVFLKEGIGLIPLKSGSMQPVIELSNPNEKDVEICIIGQITSNNELDKATASEVQAPGKKFSKALEHELSADKASFLTSHIINGDAVLPMAVAAEYLALAATTVNAGLTFIGFNDLRIQKGLVLKGNESVKLELFATQANWNGDKGTSVAEVRSNKNGKYICHARAEIVLAEKLPATAPKAIDPDTKLIYPDSINEVYSKHLFHGEFLQAITKVNGWSSDGIRAEIKTGVKPEQWFDNPAQNAWAADPLALDSAFQLMILWTIQEAGAPSLPSFAASYRQFKANFPENGVKIIAKARKTGPMMASAEIDFVDSDGQVIGRIEGYECVINENLKKAFEQRTLAGAR